VQKGVKLTKTVQKRRPQGAEIRGLDGPLLARVPEVYPNF